MKKCKEEDFPRIELLYDAKSTASNTCLFQEAMRQTLRKILPECLLGPKPADSDLLADYQDAFQASLPIFITTPCEKTPSIMSFYLVSKHRPDAFKFFFDLISRWLVP